MEADTARPLIAPPNCPAEHAENVVLLDAAVLEPKSPPPLPRELVVADTTDDRTDTLAAYSPPPAPEAVHRVTLPREKDAEAVRKAAPPRPVALEPTMVVPVALRLPAKTAPPS